MRRIVLLVLLVACSDPPTDPTVDAGIGVDADQGACQFWEQLTASNEVTPGGAWTITWQCAGGCDLPIPSLVASTRLEIVGSNLRWMNGATELEVTPATAVGGCWHTEPTENECRSQLRVCAFDGKLYIWGAVWHSPAEMWAQRWEMFGER